MRSLSVDVLCILCMRSLRLPGEIPPEISPNSATELGYRASQSVTGKLVLWRMERAEGAGQGRDGELRQRRRRRPESSRVGVEFVTEELRLWGSRGLHHQRRGSPGVAVVESGCWRRRRRLASDGTASRLAAAALMCPRPLMCPQLACPLSLSLPRHWQCGSKVPGRQRTSATENHTVELNDGSGLRTTQRTDSTRTFSEPTRQICRSYLAVLYNSHITLWKLF